MGWLMSGTGGDAITLLELIDPYEITMVVVEEMTLVCRKMEQIMV